jgi:hypothetical protein
VDQSELSPDNEALSRVRAALDQAKKKLDDGALPRGEGSAGKAARSEPPPGPLPAHFQKLQKINRILRIVTVLLVCGVVVAGISITVYHVTRMRAVAREVGEMSARIAATQEAREKELRSHAQELERLRMEVRNLRKEGEKKQARKKFLGIF